MKRLSFLIRFVFIFIFVSMCYANDDIQQIIQEEMHIQLLQVLGENGLVDNNNDVVKSDILDVLEENNEIIADELDEEKEKSDLEKEKERIAEEKYKQKIKAIKKNKLQNNDMTGYFNVGINCPIFSGFRSSNNDYDIVSPVGFSGSAVTSKSYIALKINFECDIVKYFESDESSSMFTTLSVGCTPVHNDYFFLGIFGTVGFDTIGDYSYTSVGGSGTCIWHCSNFLGVFLNLDITNRVASNAKDSENEDNFAIQGYKGTWRISPSIGLTFIFL